MIASVWDLAVEHLITFVLGLLVGFVASSRYRIVPRNGSTKEVHMETPERPDEEVPEVPPDQQGEPDSDGDDRPEPEEEGSDANLSDEAKHRIGEDEIKEREEDDGR